VKISDNIPAVHPIYPIEPWSVTETVFSLENNYRNETTFALSNGYIGTRGTFEEGYDFSETEGLEGNFINGFYESEEIRYGEWNFGFPTKSQSLLNLPNAKTTRIYANEELFDMRTGKIENYSRTLHLQEGYVSRSLVWTSPKGVKLHIETIRYVSFCRKNIMAARLQVTPLDTDVSLRFESILNGDVENHTRTTNPLVDYGPFGKRLLPVRISAEEEMLFYQGKTKNSSLALVCASLHSISGGDAQRPEWKYATSAFSASLSIDIQAKKEQVVTLEKYIGYTSSLDMPEEEMGAFITQTLKDAYDTGFDRLFSEQKKYVRNFWRSADIEISGDDAVQQGLRFNMFHTMQAAGRDGHTGMGAKGLSGEGYEGHYFWDTEIYVMPLFTHVSPELSKSLLDWRYKTLPEARERARVLGHDRGALYPWRTINGNEASTYFPLGTAQYHINADIAYAFSQYVRTTGDYTYLCEKAAEVLCETARVWADVGSFAECRGGKYFICAVTGPDEYNAIVDNNFYTNLMARENLNDALWALEWMREHEPAALQKLKDTITLTDDELIEWRRIADNMYLPYDDKMMVYLQDDGFMMRKSWDESKIPVEKRHLLYENYHPLFIWRQRMAKQADTILALYLHSNLFTNEEIRRNYDFYQTVTLHHSSLSTCIFGIVACQIGYKEEAYKYFNESARMDLDDVHHNFYAGIHAANMAGTWQAVVNGFGGLRTNNGKLQLSPFLPNRWQGYSFHFLWQQNILKVTVQEHRVSVRFIEGNTVKAGLSLELYGIKKILYNEGDEVYETI
jgi:alpha,alpha-trehalose phosphorylase